LDASDDLITLGEPPIVNKTTCDSKRKQMRESQTDRGAPHEAKDVAGNRNDISSAVSAASRQIVT
jgi:hypothetical protein